MPRSARESVRGRSAEGAERAELGPGANTAAAAAAEAARCGAASSPEFSGRNTSSLRTSCLSNVAHHRHSSAEDMPS
ncbi:unnamed protein product [Arctogadus glacialis]